MKFFTSLILVLLASGAYAQIKYTFNGNGNWSDSANWLNRSVPPLELPGGDTILIDPVGAGVCNLDSVQIISSAAHLIIQHDKAFNLTNNLVINPPRTFFGLTESNPDSLLTVPILDTADLLAHRPQQFGDTFELDMPRAQDQGAEGSCTGFACAYAVRSYHFHRDEGNIGRQYLYNSKVFSPEFSYNLNKTPGDCTTGLNYFNALKSMRNKGVCTWEYMPYSDANGCTDLPNDGQFINASFYKINYFKRLTDITEHYLKTVLSAGFPILIGVKLDYGFINLNFEENRPFTWKHRMGADRGKHALVICGWNNGKHAFKVMNSYGESWGALGFGWIDFDYLKEVLMGSTGKYEAFIIHTSLNDNIEIGNQKWMNKNLDVTNYKNGDAIPQVNDPAQWNSLTTGAWCYYNNEPQNGASFGKLYNWYAVHDPRGLAPEGWHIPNDDEWTTFSTSLGGNAVAGGAMKAGFLWNPPNTGATNSSGFTGFPGGYRHFNGQFLEIGNGGHWWSSTVSNTDRAWDRYLWYGDASITRFSFAFTYGFSVRCIKD